MQTKVQTPATARVAWSELATVDVDEKAPAHYTSPLLNPTAVVKKRGLASRSHRARENLQQVFGSFHLSSSMLYNVKYPGGYIELL